MNFDVSALPWLVDAPANFRALCKTLREADQIDIDELQRLAAFRLNTNQLTSLANAASMLAESGADLGSLSPLRLGFLHNATTDLIIPATIATALRHGILLSVVAPPFGQIQQQAFDPNSLVNASDLDAILLAQDHRGLGFASCPGDASRAEEQVLRSLESLDAIVAALMSANDAIVVVQTIPRLPYGLFGNAEPVLPGTMNSMIDAFNQGLIERALSGEIVLLDTAGLAETVGLAGWHDDALWHHAKLPFAQRYVPAFADHLGRLLGSIRGKSRKCLVLDLDNTVWGGVIGDDGMQGIVLGNGSAEGEAYLAVQQTALALRERGIVLAVCSKNTESIAREPFEKHPEMLLKDDHIAAFVANWNDKASNLIAIAETLSLGTDSFVFLDDNPAERALVREMLPMVAVPEIGDDPSLFAPLLLAAGYFESVKLTEEDRQRAAAYQAERRRQVVRAKAGDIESYLRNLEMVITFESFDELNRARVTQLINKTNQFNLTTRRYGEREVSAFETQSDTYTLAVRLDDQFGAHGLIGVVICTPGVGGSWEIDTWLMSCRVLQRRVEEAMLDRIVAEAKRRGVRTLTGLYLPTPRNDLVAEHYSRLGFERVADWDGAGDRWTIEVGSYSPFNPPITPA